MSLKEKNVVKIKQAEAHLSNLKNAKKNSFEDKYK